MPKQRKRKEGVKQRKDSPYWWASFTGASGKRVQRSTGTTDKREAINLRNKWKLETWNQQARGIEPDHFFEQLVVLYLEGTKMLNAVTIRTGCGSKHWRDSFARVV